MPDEAHSTFMHEYPGVSIRLNIEAREQAPTMAWGPGVRSRPSASEFTTRAWVMRAHVAPQQDTTG
jgi:hypothetical protein